jgi:hypothetical protein
MGDEMSLLLLIGCSALCGLQILSASLLKFVDYPAIRPKFLEELSTFVHVVSTVAG